MKRPKAARGQSALATFAIALGLCCCFCQLIICDQVANSTTTTANASLPVANPANLTMQAVVTTTPSPSSSSTAAAATTSTTTSTTTTTMASTTSTTTTTTPAPTTSTTAAPSSTTTAKSSSDYKQQPMPARSTESSTKISYDRQHESGSNQTSGQTTSVEAKSTLLDDSGVYATGEAIVSESSPVAEYLVAGDGASSGSANLDETSSDLDSSTSVSEPTVVSRHGRASSASSSSSNGGYTPPTQSRLQPYMLQNSRSHSSAADSADLLGPPTTLAPPRPQTPFDPIIVCYLGSWSVYRPSLAKFTPENINPNLCTHIIYAFAGLSSKLELKPFDNYNDINQNGYGKFTGLKDYNKQLKTLIAVGGWNEGSARFSKLVASPELRSNFIRSTIRFLREHNFDGLDLDWEYPGYRDGSSQDDKERYAQLIKELRVAFDKDKEVHPTSSKLILSVAVPAGQNNIDNGFDVPTISENVDFMNVLTYDYYTAFDKHTNHHAPLTIRDGHQTDANNKRLNIDWTINYYLSLGAAPNKLIVGVPTYGRSYTLGSALGNPPASRLGGQTLTPSEMADTFGLGARADGPGEEGQATREKGYLAYYEICQKVDTDNWQKHSLASQHQGPVAFKGNQWVSYDDIQSAVMKAEYVIRNRLGGVMIWTLDNDDFRGSCPSSRGQENPLITAIRDTLIKSVTGSVPVRPATPAPAPATTTTSTTTTSTTTTPAPTESLPTADDVTGNELTAASSGESASSSEAPSSLLRNLANSASQSQQPTTPDPGPAFTCKDEGFFPNPKDCKKYFWCLDSGPANLGVVAHAFTCPSGLFFNALTEGCDYPEKVTCKKSSKQSAAGATSTTTTSTTTTSTTTTSRPVPLPAERNPFHTDRNRQVAVRKKPSTTSAPRTTTTTTPAPTTTTNVPPTTDINELVASLLQNPQFASVISTQLKSKKASNQAESAEESISTGDVSGDGVDSSGSQGDAFSSLTADANNGNKQAQDLLQLLNLIQAMGGIDKISPLLTANKATGGSDTNDMSADDLPASRQRRPQQNEGLSSSAGDSSEPFTFNYANADNRGSDVSSSNNQFDSAAVSGGLTPEVLNNLAQLESLFAYSQPGRAPNQQPSLGDFVPPRAVESQPFTLEDAKLQAPISQPPINRQVQRQRNEPIIRVQVPDQRSSNQHRQGSAARSQANSQSTVRQQQRQQQVQNQFADPYNFLPYLEGDVRQPVGQRQQPQSSQVIATTSNTRQQQQASRPQPQSAAIDEELLANLRAAPAPQQRQSRPRQQPQAQPQQQQQQPTQRSRRPPNRERSQRLNTADFPIQSQQAPTTRMPPASDRPRSLVLLSAGPPTGEIASSGAASDSLESLSDRALEEKLRLLEGGYIAPTSFSLSSNGDSPSASSLPSSASESEELQPAARSTGSSESFNFFQPTLTPTTSQASSFKIQDNFETTGASLTASREDEPAGSSGRAGASDNSDSTASPEAPKTASLALDVNGPGTGYDPESGKLVCNRRGVFAHPNSCGQFIVCAPQSRSQRSLRAFEHHCPAEHIFHDSWGRCRPKSLQADLGKFCKDSR